VAQKFATKLDRHSRQAGDSRRDPESRKFKAFWMPVFTGMTVKRELLVKRISGTPH
jgi:fatty-acid desaturase